MEAAAGSDLEIIQANCRAYDRLDKQEARYERKSEIAEKVIAKIKNVKKLIKDKVRSKVEQ